jgi:hypothetical protein
MSKEKPEEGWDCEGIRNRIICKEMKLKEGEIDMTERKNISRMVTLEHQGKGWSLMKSFSLITMLMITVGIVGYINYATFFLK